MTRKPKYAYIPFKARKELKDAIKNAAHDKRQTMSKWLRTVAARALKRPDLADLEGEK